MTGWIWLSAIALAICILGYSFAFLIRRSLKLFRALSALASKLGEIGVISRQISELPRPKSQLESDPIPLWIERLRFLATKRELKRERERRLIKRLLSR